MPATLPGLSPEVGVPPWRPWSPTEREDFFEAIARHRRAAWRVTAACALAYGVLALVVALLLAPLLYAMLGLVLDVANLIVPAPDLLGYAGRTINALMESKATPSAAHLLQLMVLAAAPGLVLMLGTAVVLRRALLRSALSDPDKVVGRPPDTTVLAEQRFLNTTEEMAVAAAIPPPRVIVLEGGANAAAFGPDERHATVLVGALLIQSLNREQMQGVAGHLIASIADGDMTIGLRTAITLGLFSLAARMSGGLTDRSAFSSTRRLIGALVTPSAANLDFILSQLSDPFAADLEAKDNPNLGGEEARAQALRQAHAAGAAVPGEHPPPAQSPGRSQGSAKPTSDNLTWKEWALMPLMGPVFLSGFLGGLVNTLMLTPAIAFAWRQRKYMADATAVRLTRDPNALAGALGAMAKSAGSMRTASWAGHLCVVDPGTKQDAGLLGGSIVSIFPSLQRRLKALVQMGAEDRSVPQSRFRMPIPAVILIAALAAIVALLLATVVVLLVWVSVALSGLFTLVPVAILHAVLR